MKKLLFLLLFIPLFGLSQISISKPVAAISTTTDATSFSTSSFTPSANAVLTVALRMPNALFATHTVSGGGLTWTKMNINPSGASCNDVWWAVTGGSPSSMTITIATNGVSATACLATILEFTGADVASPIRQSKGVSGSGANPSITLDNALLTNNGYAGTVGTGQTNVITEPGSWTEADELNVSTPTTRLESAYRATGETGSTITWTMTNTSWVVMAFEVNKASSATNLGTMFKP